MATVKPFSGICNLCVCHFVPLQEASNALFSACLQVPLAHCVQIEIIVYVIFDKPGFCESQTETFLQMPWQNTVQVHPYFRLLACFDLPHRPSFATCRRIQAWGRSRCTTAIFVNDWLSIVNICDVAVLLALAHRVSLATSMPCWGLLHHICKLSWQCPWGCWFCNLIGISLSKIWSFWQSQRSF